MDSIAHEDSVKKHLIKPPKKAKAEAKNLQQNLHRKKLITRRNSSSSLK